MRFIAAASAAALAALHAGSALAAPLAVNTIALAKRAYSGDGTVYFPGTGGLGWTGACGTYLDPSAGWCALGHELYDSTRPAAGVPSSLCGATAEVCGPAGCSRCIIADRCHNCAASDIDMTFPTFRGAVGENPTRVRVSWSVVDSSAPAPPPPPPAPPVESHIPSEPRAPGGAIDYGGSGFSCVRDGNPVPILSPVKITAAGEAACLSADSVHCILASSYEECDRLAAQATTFSPYLE
ncbi:hypothetical protein DFJ74DRAFT_744095 [Hyaloraphidium curvatum]|nr:hypothetical protein DFJ74DRAFT_744095 [Hyaloraphidium curvatum]